MDRSGSESKRWTVFALLPLLLVPVLGCGAGESGALGPNPIVGELAVKTSTSGTNLDSDGYDAVLEPGTEDEETEAIGLDDSVTFPSVEAGFRMVELTDVASNCSVSGANPREVEILTGATTQTTFEVTCG